MIQENKSVQSNNPRKFVIQTNIPQLRFPEFTGEWEKKKLGEVSEINPTNRNLPDKFIYIDLESVSNGELLKENEITIENAPSRAQRFLQPNDVLFQMVRPYQKNNLFFDKTGTYVASTGYAQIRTEQNPKYLFQYLHFQTFVDRVIERCTGTSYPSINSTDLSKIEFSYPSIEEQTKIATFLTAVDKKLQFLKKKHRLLEQYKKGVMQKLFEHGLNGLKDDTDNEGNQKSVKSVNPKNLRFRQKDGKDFPEWEVKKLGEVVNEINEKTKTSGQYRILSSTTKGLFNQDEYFTRDIASKDNTGYKILRKEQLVFSPQNLWLGNINVNMKYEIGIVSPSYKIFSFNEKYTSAYYCQYLLLMPEMMFKYEQSSVQGASVVRRNLDMDKFLDIEINLPSIEEQTAIANFLSALDEKINQTQTQIEKTEVWKKGLLQKMFV